MNQLKIDQFEGSLLPDDCSSLIESLRITKEFEVSLFRFLTGQVKFKDFEKQIRIYNDCLRRLVPVDLIAQVDKEEMKR